MLLKMMASMGEAETIVLHPDLLESLVAGARDQVASRANLAELRALITPRGVRPSMRFSLDDVRRLAVPTLMIWGDRDPVVPLHRTRARSRPRSRTPDSRHYPPGTCPSWATPIGWPHCWRTSSWRPDQERKTRETGRVLVGG